MKKRRNSFLTDIFALMLSQIAVKLLGMIYSLYLTNKNGFGDAGNAIYMAAYQVYAMFLSISSIGIPNAISRIVAENSSRGDYKACKSILKISLVIFSFLGLISSIVLYFGSDFIASSLLEIDASADILRILAPSIVFVTIESVLRGYFNGLQHVEVSAKVQTCEQLFKTILTVVFVETVSRFTNFNTELMARSSMLAATFATIVSLIYSTKEYFKINRKEKFQMVATNKQTIRVILKELFIIAIPLTITAFLMILESNIDSITIVRLLKDKIGIESAKEKYGIISSKVNLLVSLPMSLNGAVAIALIPEIASNNINRNKENLEKNVNFSFLITLFISVPIVLGMFIYSEEIINFLYPKANKGSELLRLGAITIIFTTLTQTMSGILQGVGDAKAHLKAIIVGICFKLILNFIFIPNLLFLEKGALISSSISDFAIFLIIYLKMRKKLKLNLHIMKNFVKILFVMLVSVFIVKILMVKIVISFRIKFLIEILILAIIYIILTSKLKIIDLEIVSNRLNISKNSQK